jgi:hypothetical protein
MTKRTNKARRAIDGARTLTNDELGAVAGGSWVWTGWYYKWVTPPSTTAYPTGTPVAR